MARDTGHKVSKKGVAITAATVGAGVILFYLWRHYQATGTLSPFSTSPGATGTTATDTTPTVASTTVGTPTDTTPPKVITNLAQWKQAVLDYMVNTVGISGGENVAATGLANALSGHCLGPNQYAALNAALGAIGQPPGGTILRLSQCKPKPKPTTSHTPSETPRPTPTTHVAQTAAARARTAANRARHRAIKLVRK